MLQEAALICDVPAYSDEASNFSVFLLSSSFFILKYIPNQLSAPPTNNASREEIGAANMATATKISLDLFGGPSVTMRYKTKPIKIRVSAVAISVICFMDAPKALFG
jgi:hypothetical protein